jgi:hypothetical protein
MEVNRPGFIPVEIRSSPDQVVWLDLGRYHFYEGFFHQSLARYAALCRKPPERCLTPIDELASFCHEGSLYPTGFIFHSGRCGSTLLAKILARSRGNLVFSEAAPHNQIWRILPRDEARAIELYRNLVLAMGRKRVSSHRAHFIKFTSFNIVQFPFIRAAFPDVPALFLFRDRAAVVESFTRNPPGWLGQELGIGRSWNSPAEAVDDFLEAADSIRDVHFRRFDYASLTPELLPSMLEFFNVHPDPKDLRLMLSEFEWDSKAAGVRRPFLIAVPQGYRA